jgi:hypothetical protein
VRRLVDLGSTRTETAAAAPVATSATAHAAPPPDGPPTIAAPVVGDPSIASPPAEAGRAAGGDGVVPRPRPSTGKGTGKGTTGRRRAWVLAGVAVTVILVVASIAAVSLLPGRGAGNGANPPNLGTTGPRAGATASPSQPPTLRDVGGGQLQLGPCGAMIFDTGKLASGAGPFDVRWNCSQVDNPVGLYFDCGCGPLPYLGLTYFGKVPYDSVDAAKLVAASYTWLDNPTRDPHLNFNHAVLDANGGLDPGVVFGVKATGEWIKIQVVDRSMPNLTIKWRVYKPV